ncbi:hypothetical protein PM082_014939 [Marasmius tenuissimus]|nr:hypothetical protein PM082_014939 [Marasmius tenuissimus]
MSGTEVAGALIIVFVVILLLLVLPCVCAKGKKSPAMSREERRAERKRVEIELAKLEQGQAHPPPVVTTNEPTESTWSDPEMADPPPYSRSPPSEPQSSREQELVTTVASLQNRVQELEGGQDRAGRGGCNPMG